LEMKWKHTATTTEKEKVAIGVQAGLFLGDRSQSRHQPGLQLLRIGGDCRPLWLRSVLADVKPAQLNQVATAACSKGETIHNEPSTVTPRNAFYASIVCCGRFSDEARLECNARLSRVGRIKNGPWHNVYEHFHPKVNQCNPTIRLT